jgi:hypothetical protein
MLSSSGRLPEFCTATIFIATLSEQMNKGETQPEKAKQILGSHTTP